MAIRNFNSTAPELTRLGRFLAVGALGTALDFGLLAALKISGASTLLANSFSFTIGLINNYTWNSRWTFADRRNENAFTQFIQFFLVSAAGLALNNAIVLLLEAPLGTWIGDPALGYLPAKVIATGVTVFWNYLANRNWTFR